MARAVAALGDAAICRRWDLYSRVASTSAGVELRNCEILVLGNGHCASDLVIGHDVMAAAIDAGAVRRNAAVEHGVTHHRFRPDGLHQGLFGDQLTRLLHE